MFDFRKNQQYFRRNDGKNVYCWKSRRGGYDIGINGTSHHTHAQDKATAKNKVFELLHTAKP